MIHVRTILFDFDHNCILLVKRKKKKILPLEKFIKVAPFKFDI